MYIVYIVQLVKLIYVMIHKDFVKKWKYTITNTQISINSTFYIIILGNKLNNL